MTDKQIIIDGVDVSGCDELWLNFEKNYNSKCIRFKDVYSQCSYCKDNPNCEYKQLQKEKFENLNNRQIVESAENLIYENSELYKNLKEKEQECDRYRKALDEIQILAGKIISNDDQPACVYDVECPLNGGVGFDNHCNENCPFVTAKQISTSSTKRKMENFK